MITRRGTFRLLGVTTFVLLLRPLLADCGPNLSRIDFVSAANRHGCSWTNRNCVACGSTLTHDRCPPDRNRWWHEPPAAKWWLRRRPIRWSAKSAFSSHTAAARFVTAGTATVKWSAALNRYAVSTAILASPAVDARPAVGPKSAAASAQCWNTSDRRHVGLREDRDAGSRAA